MWYFQISIVEITFFCVLPYNFQNMVTLFGKILLNTVLYRGNISSITLSMTIGYFFPPTSSNQIIFIEITEHDILYFLFSQLIVYNNNRDQHIGVWYLTDKLDIYRIQLCIRWLFFSAFKYAIENIKKIKIILSE